ncbi:MAG: thioesterase domain-containing protein [Rhizonema sp. PD37]|nr:thioesterase domain-containing protein [Rhizonema sp. PD37]
MSQSILSLPDDEKLNLFEETEVFVFPTSFAQQRLWFLDQLAPGNPFYNVSTALRLRGSLDITALKQTFNEIVRRHETLRTTFVMVQQPVQAIAPSLTILLPLVDLRNFHRLERETQVRRIATAEAQHPFNLTTGPLLRVKLLQLDEAEYVLLLNIHHITVRLMKQIHKQFESELPLSSLFLNQTIESLAISLSSKADSLPWSPLVPIQPAGSSPAFFCVHPIFGVVFPYYELAHHLGTNQPFYGLQPIGLDGKSSPLTRIEDMAAYYIEAMRRVQPKSPYYLGGWSFGGWVAFEMAQQLQKSGEEVALLAVLDTLAPIPGNIPSLGDGFKFMLTTVARYIWPFFLDYLYLIIAITKNEIHSFTSRLTNFPKIVRYSFWESLLRSLQTNMFPHLILKEDATVNLISEESKLRLLSELAIRPMLRVLYANSQAVLNYVPQAYPKQIHLFRTKVQSSIAKEDPSMGWDQLVVGETEIHHLPGNHLTMLKKPHIQVLATQLRACIEKAQNLK